MFHSSGGGRKLSAIPISESSPLVIRSTYHLKLLLLGLLVKVQTTEEKVHIIDYVINILRSNVANLDIVSKSGSFDNSFNILSLH